MLTSCWETTCTTYLQPNPAAINARAWRAAVKAETVEQKAAWVIATLRRRADKEAAKACSADHKHDEDKTRVESPQLQARARRATKRAKETPTAKAAHVATDMEQHTDKRAAESPEQPVAHLATDAA